MLLKSLEVYNFRNLSGGSEFSSNLNIICGDNGQGKTNWLEAIYVLAATKSFRTSNIYEAVRFEQHEATVRGEVELGETVQRSLQVTLHERSKGLFVNGKKETVQRYLGQLHAVSFTANDLEIVRGQPEARRRFLDRGAASIHPAYIKTLSDYVRVVSQKNRILQNLQERERTLVEAARLLQPWNEQLVRLGAQVYHTRVDFVSRLADVLERKLFAGEELTIRYHSALEGKGDLSSYDTLLAERLELRMQAEMASGHALVGPHRDDLELRFDGHELRAFGSAGQQRSALIILDLAAISVYYSWHHDYPIFLFDDVDAELDGKRIGYLLEYLSGRTQTFITTSKESLVNEYSKRAEIYRVVNGAIGGRASTNIQG